jgi:hypothetical protein
MIRWTTGVQFRSSAFRSWVALRRPPYVNTPMRPSSFSLSRAGSASYAAYMLANSVSPPRLGTASA